MLQYWQNDAIQGEASMTAVFSMQKMHQAPVILFFSMMRGLQLVLSNILFYVSNIKTQVMNIQITFPEMSVMLTCSTHYFCNVFTSFCPLVPF